VSYGGRLPSGTEIGEGGYHGETYGAEHADLAYKGLGGTVPPHSRAVSTAPSECYTLRVFNGCCNHLSFFLSFVVQMMLAKAAIRSFDVLKILCDGEGAVGALSATLQTRGIRMAVSRPGHHVVVVERMA